MDSTHQNGTRDVSEILPLVSRLREEVSRVLVGQRQLFDRLLMGIIIGGHVLVEGLPGLAKTTAVKCLADGLSLRFSRIQFTPDLLPSDLIGVEIYNPQKGEFSVKRGPVFANIVLADEINRAPSKVQSALLEAMQERQVTIGTESFRLPRPFLVLATQNPLEQQGTYPLPEAQLDRFLLKVLVSYPTEVEECEIVLRGIESHSPVVSPCISEEDIASLQSLQSAVFIDEKIRNYVVALVRCTRDPKAFGAGDLAPLLAVGASPRASIALTQCARVHALLDGRSYVTPQDVKAVAHDVLRHRIIASYEAEAQEIPNDLLISKVLDTVDVP
jgi:MoxR-like ATPase